MTEPPAAPGTPPPPPPAPGEPAGPSSGSITAAGVLQLILGGLITIFMLYGLIGLLGAGGSVPSEARGIVGAATGIVAIFLIYGLAQLLAGVFTMQRKNVGRILGIVLASLGILLFLLGLIQSFQPQVTGFDFETGAVESGVQIGSILINLVALAANVTIVVLLARGGRAFTR